MPQANKTHGRNKKSAQNARYKAEQRHEKSHLKRLKAHIVRYDHSAASGIDQVARTRLEIYAQRLGVAATRSAMEFLKQAA